MQSKKERKKSGGKDGKEIETDRGGREKTRETGKQKKLTKENKIEGERKKERKKREGERR